MVGAFSLMLLGYTWTQWGHDPQNTCTTTEGKGAFSSVPVVRWKVEGEDLEIGALVDDVDGDGENEVLAGFNGPLGYGYYSFNGSDGSIEWFFPATVDTSTHGYLFSSGVEDVDGDGEKEVVFLSVVCAPAPDTGAYLFCVSGSDGSLKWSQKVADDTWNYVTPPKFSDFTGDGVPEIVIPAWPGTLRVFAGDGTLLWKSQSTFSTLTALADVNGDGAQEIIIPSFGGTLEILDGLTGSPITVPADTYDGVWQHINGPTGALAGDLNKDGSLDIFFYHFEDTTESPSITLRRYAIIGDTLKEIWHGSTTSLGSSLVSGDVDGDSKDELLGIEPYWGDNMVHVLCYDVESTSCTLLWQDTVGAFDPCLGGSMGDLDGDGKPELLLSNWNNDTLYCLNADDGSLLWSYATGYRDLHEIALGDVDGDSLLEIVVPAREALIVLDTEELPAEEDISKAPLSVISGRGKLLLSVQSPVTLEIYSLDGRRIKELNLNPGRAAVSLKPGLYLWRAGKFSGKAVVKP